MPVLALLSPQRRPVSLAGFFRSVLDRAALRRSRSRLTMLDDHLLRDIGLSREDATAEAIRTDRDAPDHWYCR